MEASLLTAECTISSALERRESRGAHQRSDFKKTNFNENKNYAVSLINNKLFIESINLKNLDKELEKMIKKDRKEYDFKGVYLNKFLNVYIY